jgi:predicted methyltransferase
MIMELTDLEICIKIAQLKGDCIHMEGNVECVENLYGVSGRYDPIANWTSLIETITNDFEIVISNDCVSLLYFGDINMEDINQPIEESLGKAVAICYLRSIELLEKVKKCEVKNAEDEKAYYDKGFSSLEEDSNPYRVGDNPWARKPWQHGHDAKWGA